MNAIFKREMKSYFTSPLGYIFLAAILFFGGLYFALLINNSVSDISFLFQNLLLIVTVLIPLLTMRLMSEEKKQKTDQLLLTAPVNIGGVVLGKYFAALVMYLISISSTIVYMIVLATFKAPNWNIFLGNFLALALLGGALLAIGLFISSLTESQVIAAISTFAVMIIILLLDGIATSVPEGILRKIIVNISFTSRYKDLVGGILNISHVIFFISVIVIFNFLTAKMLERKRWS